MIKNTVGRVRQPTCEAVDTLSCNERTSRNGKVASLRRYVALLPSYKKRARIVLAANWHQDGGSLRPRDTGLTDYKRKSDRLALPTYPSMG
jgi:hypothetical protein